MSKRLRISALFLCMVMMAAPLKYADVRAENVTARNTAEAESIAQDNIAQDNITQETTGQDNITQETTGQENTAQESGRQENITQEVTGQDTAEQEITEQESSDNGTGKPEPARDDEGLVFRHLSTYHDGRLFAAEGMLPVNACLRASDYSSEDQLSFVQENIDGLADTSSVLFMYDLQILLPDGSEYEPEDDSIRVSITDAGLRDMDEGLLYHVNENAESWNEAFDVMIDEVDYDLHGSTLSFEAEAFSPYILLEENKITASTPGTMPYVMTLPRTNMSDPMRYVSTSAKESAVNSGGAYGGVVIRESGGDIKKYTYRDIWLIQQVPGSRYYFIRNIYNQGNLGSGEYGRLGLWPANASSDTQQFRITKNADNTYVFHLVYNARPGTDCVLDASGSALSGGAAMKIGGKTGAAGQSFNLYKAATHDMFCQLAEGGIKVDNNSGNNISIWDLNALSLDQNTFERAVSMANISTPSDSGIVLSAVKPTDTYPLGAQKRIRNLAESADGTYMPIYKAAMDKWNGDWNNENRYIEVVYPEAGTININGSVKKIGAVVRFYNIRPSDPASGRTYQLSKNVPDICDDPDVTNMYISTDMYRGYWMIGASGIDIDMTFYDASSYKIENGKGIFTGQPVYLDQSYMTFNSLNGDLAKSQTGLTNPGQVALGITPNQCYTEFVGKLTHEKDTTGIYKNAWKSDTQTEGIVLSLEQGDADTPNDALVSNVVLEDLEIWEPLSASAYNYGTYRVFAGKAEWNDEGKGGQTAPWTDRIGGTCFTRNSVTLPMKVLGEDHTTTASFIIGSLEGSMWVSFSSMAVDGDVPKPVKAIDEEGTAGVVSNQYDLDDRPYEDAVSEIEKDPYGDMAEVSLENGKVLYHFIQRVPQLGIDINEPLRSFVLEDVISEDFEIIQAGVGKPAQTKDGLWESSQDGQKVIFTYRCNGSGAFQESSGGKGTINIADVTEDLYICVQPIYGKADCDKLYENRIGLRCETSGKTQIATESNKVYVKPVLPSGRIDVEKYDTASNPLKDVRFELYTGEDGIRFPVVAYDHEKYGTIVRIKGENGYDASGNTLTAETDAQGHCVFQGLRDGVYYLKEVKTGEGHQLLTEYVKVSVKDGRGRIVVGNASSIALNTGGRGRLLQYPAMIFTGVGIVIWLAAIYLTNRVKSTKSRSEK